MFSWTYDQECTEGKTSPEEEKIVVADTVSQATYCSEAITSLGTDRDREICSTDCQDGGKGPNSLWCRFALDDSNIHFCALTIASKDAEHGGLGYGCMTVGNVQDFYAMRMEMEMIATVHIQLHILIRSYSSVIPTSTIIKNTFPTHHSIISQC
ncbi:hypothetical protein CDV31_010072 [Fusarium ambrosium]|uniref:Uncharacterized protein n=1 Tax=Fusarium ambrosium TaxID=131363 RepID=A0A428TQL5_9HYPO|nr:hypothetical protein CDV31_010072 [Fusarium ambrosium]